MLNRFFLISKRPMGLGAGLLTGMLLACGASAQDLTPSADGVAGKESGQSHGKSRTLLVSNGHRALRDNWSYLRFDLTGLHAPVGRAVLAINISSAATVAVSVNATGDDWNEDTLAWRTRPSRGTALGSLKSSGTGEVLLDVTEYVRAQAHGDGLASFVLSIQTVAKHAVRIHSRESQYSPILLIDSETTGWQPSSASSGRTRNTAAVISLPTDNVWTPCVMNGSTCDNMPLQENTARLVRYGVPGAYATRRFYYVGFYGKPICTVKAFGVDPAPGKAKSCDYSSPLVRTLAAPTNPMGPAVDLKAIPVGDPGTSQLSLADTVQTPVVQPDGVSAFRITCMYSHMNFDDPIIYPGTVGRSHLHTFFGNKLTNATSTRSSIETKGNSTCHGGVMNRSAYWVPSMIDTRSGKPVAPIYNMVYYKSGYNHIRPAQIQAMPPGLRMISGNATSSTKQRWGTNPSVDSMRDFVTWACGNDTIISHGAIPNNCTAGFLKMSFEFPQCWDGINLDSPNHKSHMADPIWTQDGTNRRKCPATHPVAIPSITFNVRYPVNVDGETAFWRLSSDMYPTTTPGGYSVHGDWFNGWDPQFAAIWLEKCIRAGVDCHATLMGDGRLMYWTPATHQINPPAPVPAQSLTTPDALLPPLLLPTKH